MTLSEFPSNAHMAGITARALQADPELKNFTTGTSGINDHPSRNEADFTLTLLDESVGFEEYTITVSRSATRQPSRQPAKETP